METLPPIKHRTEYNRTIEKEINGYFAEAIFAPLQILLHAHRIPIDKRYQAIPFDEFGRDNSATTALEEALNSGRVQYAEGVFSGQFSSSITRELRTIGATFNKSAGTFTIAEGNIPMELRGALATASAKSKTVTDQVLRLLTEMEANLAAAKIGLQLGRALDAVTADLGKQFLTTTAQMRPEDIALQPVIDDGLRARLRKDYTENTELNIKKFAKARIPELRKRVEENAFKFGGRTDRLAKIIEAEFGVSKRKAEFLADQETGLLVSKYRKEKYVGLGIQDYTWSTSHDSRVRHSHRVLDGKRFSFAVGAQVAPPGQPARYCNPGEDYRCRCVPRPIINLAELAA